MENKELIVILGPTASGKTKFAVDLALQYNTVVISADSRQFYKNMDIGTAKPTTEEMKGIPHYFINSLDIDQSYTAGKFEEEVIALLPQLFRDHNKVIMVGGSMMYIDAVCYGLDDIPSDTGIRNQLIEEEKQLGLEKLIQELKEVDPEYAQEADLQNPHRVMRGLEVYRASGRTYSSFRNQEPKKRPFTIKKIGIQIDRETLFNRINDRVDQMIQNGLVKEVKSLQDYAHLQSMNTVGYKEITNYLNGAYDQEEAIRLIKRNTRNYAKRQMTWFKKQKDIEWVNT